eukprot:172751-Pelagomonas_calceolata.AAC.2
MAAGHRISIQSMGLMLSTPSDASPLSLDCTCGSSMSHPDCTCTHSLFHPFSLLLGLQLQHAVLVACAAIDGGSTCPDCTCTHLRYSGPRGSWVRVQGGACPCSGRRPRPVSIHGFKISERIMGPRGSWVRAQRVGHAHAPEKTNSCEQIGIQD